MSERIFTLFGEEIVPEPVKTVGKGRAKKSKDKEDEEKAEEATQTGDQAPAAEVFSEETIVEEEPAVVEEVYEQPAEEINEVAAEEEVEIIDESQQHIPKKERTTKPPANLPEDWEGDKQYYSIGEVAALFNVKTSHIRFWTNEFKLKVRTTRKGDRLYSPAQIKEVRAIYHLVKERGFTLTGAKAKLKSQNKIDVESIDLKQSLLKLRGQLETIKKQLTA